MSTLTRLYKFVIYQDACGEWRWRLKSSNGRIVADSGEGYKTRSGAQMSVDRLIRADLLAMAKDRKP